MISFILKRLDAPLMTVGQNELQSIPDHGLLICENESREIPYVSMFSSLQNYWLWEIIYPITAMKNIFSDI